MGNKFLVAAKNSKVLREALSLLFFLWMMIFDDDDLIDLKKTTDCECNIVMSIIFT
jgi:hypothetical protein